MSVRAGLAVLLGFVPCTALSYGVFFNGHFSDGLVPVWGIATSVIATVTIVVGLAWWLTKASGWSAPTRTNDDAKLYIAVTAISALSQALTIGAEILLNTPGLWLVIPIATIGYGLFIAWFQKRYGSPRTVAGEPQQRSN